MNPVMRTSALLAAGAALLLNAGCSGDTVRRTSFETLQNLRAQQCSRDLSGHCPPREDYEEYRRKRAAALQGDRATEPTPLP
jgi:hypothetical protein